LQYCGEESLYCMWQYSKTIADTIANSTSTVMLAALQYIHTCIHRVSKERPTFDLL